MPDKLTRDYIGRPLLDANTTRPTDFETPIHYVTYLFGSTKNMKKQKSLVYHAINSWYEDLFLLYGEKTTESFISSLSYIYYNSFLLTLLEDEEDAQILP